MADDAHDDALKKLQDYKDTLIKKAELLIAEGVPEKICALKELLATPNFSERRFSNVHQELNIPVPNLTPLRRHLGGGDGDDAQVPAHFTPGRQIMFATSGSVAYNHLLCEMIDQVKPFIRKMIEDFNLLKMWISFMIPKIEDGNNFGVCVQEEALSEIHAVETKGISSLDKIMRYFLTRARLIAKVATYPNIDDYRAAVTELDERQYLSIYLVVCEMRNCYSSIHDLITKNMDKLTTPRTSNTENLY